MTTTVYRKLSIMGCNFVGKSTMALQFTENRYTFVHSPTVEYTYTKQLDLGKKSFLVDVVDTAGCDTYFLFHHAQALDIHGYILTYSIDSRKSFKIVKELYEKMKSMCVNSPMILVGNKADLREERRVSYEEGKKLAKSWGVKFFEVSSKIRCQVHEAFEELLKSIEKKEGHCTSSCVIQ